MAKRTPMNSIYAWRLLGDHLCSNVPPELRICNPCFSPVSLHVSSTLLAGGGALSSGDGELRSILLHFLRLNGLGQHAGGRRSRRRRTQRDAFAAATARSDGNGPGAYFFNAVWVKSSIFYGFEELTRDTGTTLYPADFQNHAVKIRNEVNSWLCKSYASPMPRHLIPRDSVGVDTEFISGNVLSFFGEFAPELGLELDTSGGRKDGLSKFYQINGRPMSVPFMTSREPQLIASYIGFKSLRMPYKQGRGSRRFSMCLFLPDDPQDGVFHLLEKLANESDFMDRHLPTERVPVREFKVPIKRGTVAFMAAGVAWPPRGKRTEHFNPYCYSSLVFKDFSDKNEKGKGKKKATMVEETGFSFVADHAFLYAILDDVSGMVLMVGLSHNPGCMCPVFSGTDFSKF